MLGWLKTLFPVSTTQTGVILDLRTDEEKSGDIHFTEIAAGAAPVNWQAVSIPSLRTFPDLYQAQSYACVAFTMAKMLGIMRFLRDGTFVAFSPGDIYTRRTTRNSGDGQGMNSTDPFRIASEGVTLDILAPSQGLNETQINGVVALQAALQALGFFPQNVTPTGLYGALTAKAVYDWQVARSVAPKVELDALQGRQFGPASIEIMNQEL